MFWTFDPRFYIRLVGYVNSIAEFALPALLEILNHRRANWSFSHFNAPAGIKISFMFHVYWLLEALKNEFDIVLFVEESQLYTW